MTDTCDNEDCGMELDDEGALCCPTCGKDYCASCTTLHDDPEGGPDDVCDECSPRCLCRDDKGRWTSDRPFCPTHGGSKKGAD